MNTSLRLLLEDFLGLMREEGELDVFLPLLLSSMGHEIVYRAQKGTRQYGVDISSVGKDADGKKKLFLWLVKCGDIGRTDWDSGPQSIRQSINDVGDVYVRTHVSPQHAGLPKKLVVLTNGDFHANLNQSIASFLSAWSRSQAVESQQVNGSTLAAWTEAHLLDEHVLPPGNRALLRRMLANVGSPELSVAVGQQLISQMVKASVAPGKSPAATKKRLLTGLRGIRTALSVLQVWALNEQNLVAPYRLSEFALLTVWASLHTQLAKPDRAVAKEFALLLVQMANIAETYHQKLQPYYATKDAFGHALPDSLLVANAVFQEVGRLGFQGYVWAFLAVDGKSDAAEGQAGLYANRLLALLASHGASQSPSFDHQAVDIHAAMLLLLVTGHREDAKEWVTNLASRLAQAVRTKKFSPLTAPFEDALLVRHGYDEASDEFKKTSVLLPILLVWSAVLDAADVYQLVRERILPSVAKTTPNFWSSDVGFDALVADPAALHEHGVGEGVLNVPADPDEFLRSMSVPLAGVEAIESAAWYKLRAPYVPLLAALLWRLQVPREMLVRHAMAVAHHVT